MNWVDLAIIGILTLSAILSFFRGLIREVLGIGAWVGAIAIALTSLPHARPITKRWIDDPVWTDPATMLATFLLALLILSIIARLGGKLVRGSVLGGVDRTLGVLFGLARGAALVVIAYILGGMLVAVEQWPDPVLHARALHPTYEGAAWLARQLPEEYRPRVKPPPGQREATIDSLLRATPQGRATEGRGR
jgi:membrane protein required for colicin V production